MNLRATSLTLGVTLIAINGIASTASAGTIVADFSGPAFGPGLGVKDFDIPDPPQFPNNNDYIPGNPNGPNTVPGQARFDQVAPIFFPFLVTNSNGTTEYLFNETITNNTNSDWNDFHFDLGFTVDNNFIKSNLIDFLDFDVINIAGIENANAIPNEKTPPPTSTAFSRVQHKENSIWWDQGIVPKDGAVNFTFSIDIPDGNIGMPDEALLRNPQGDIVGYNFVLKQVPSVPEPTSTLSLLALGTLGAGSLLRKKKQKSVINQA